MSRIDKLMTKVNLKPKNESASNDYDRVQELFLNFIIDNPDASFKNIEDQITGSLKILKNRWYGKSDSASITTITDPKDLPYTDPISIKVGKALTKESNNEVLFMYSDEDNDTPGEFSGKKFSGRKLIEEDDIFALYVGYYNGFKVIELMYKDNFEGMMGFKSSAYLTVGKPITLM